MPHFSANYLGSSIFAITLISLTLFMLNQEIINIFMIQAVKFARPALFMKSDFNMSMFDAAINNHT